MTDEIKKRLDSGEGEELMIIAWGQSFQHEARKLDGIIYSRGVDYITLSIVYDWTEYKGQAASYYTTSEDFGGPATAEDRARYGRNLAAFIKSMNRDE